MLIQRDILFNRIWQGRVLVLLALLVVFLGTMGAYTLYRSPILFFDSEYRFPVPEQNIQSIAHIKLNPRFFGDFPEFLYPTEETRWWQMHEGVYDILGGRRSVEVELMGQGGVLRREKMLVSFMSLSEVVRRTWLIYLVALRRALLLKTGEGCANPNFPATSLKPSGFICRHRFRSLFWPAYTRV